MPVIQVTTLDDELNGAGQLSLREAIAQANAAPGSDIITFSEALSGGTLRLTQGEIEITDALVVDGDLDDDGLPDIRITGDANGDDMLDADGNTDAGASRPEDDTANGEDDDGDGVIDDAGPDLMADNSRIFAVSNPNADLAIEGLILTGGLAEDFTGVGGGGGAVRAAHSLSLVNATVAGNASTGFGPGGGLDVDFALTLSNVTLSGNIARSQGGGAYAEYSVVVAGSTINDNISNAQGGGISSDYTIAIADSSISGNSARNRGGGLYADVLVDVVDSAFSGNTGDDGGAVAAGDGVARIFGSNFTANSARDDGGAVYADPRVEAFDSLFTGNYAGGDGGAIASDETVLVRSGSFTDNSSGNRGGAVYGDYEVRIESSTLTGNQTDRRGGAVYADELAIIRDSTLSGNSVLGLGAYSFGGGGAVAADGIIRASASSFTANSAQGSERSSGGALYAEVVEIVASTVSGNATTGENSGGGGIFGEEQVVLVDSTVSDNRTEGANAQGGGVFGGFVLGVGSLVSDNATTGDGAAGGGIFAGGVNGSGGLTLVNSTLSGNHTAGENAPGGGAYAASRLEGVQITVTGNSIAGPITPTQGAGDAGGGGLAIGPAPEARLVLANSILLGNAATDATATGREVGAGSGLDGQFFFRGLNIVGEDGAVFDASAANAQIGGGADSVINAAPETVFATPAATLSDEDGDGVSDDATGVTGAMPDRRGGQREAVALADAPGNPAIDAGDPEAAVVLSESLLGIDLNGDGDGTDLLLRMADLRFDGRGAFALRSVAWTGEEALPDLGAFELQETTEIAIAALEADRDEGDAGPTAFTFTVNRSGSTAGPLSLDYAVTGRGAAPADAADFVSGALPSGTVTIAAGEATATLTVEVAGDGTAESDEGFEVRLANAPADTAIATATAEGTIRDDDTMGAADPGDLSILALDPERPEGDAGITRFLFEILRTGGADGEISASFTVSGHGPDAADPADFSGGAFPSGSIGFADGQTAQTLSVEVTGDGKIEADEGFSVVLTGASTGVGLPVDTADALILNDDALTGGANGRPLAAPDIAATTAATPLTIAVLANDSDPDGDALSLSAVGPTLAGGTATVEMDAIRYTPAAGFEGVDRFTYDVTDGAGSSGTAEVTVVVGALPAPAREEGVLRGTARDDLIAIGQNAIYLGGDGDDTYLLSEGASPGTSVIGDDGGRIQLVEGLEVLSALLLPNALQLDFGNGTRVQLLDSPDFMFEVGGNATTGKMGTILDYAGFADTVFGGEVPATGQLVAGPVIVEDPADAMM